MFALRAALHGSVGDADRGFASEGTWQDLLGAAARRKAETGAREDELATLVREEKEAQRALEEAAARAYPALMETREGRAYRRGHGSPDDIVVRSREIHSAEGGRPHELTVTTLVEGAKVRQRIERSLRRRAEKEIEKERARAVLASLGERQAIEKKIAALQAATETTLASLSPLRAPLAEVQRTCAARGARLVVLALPIDVEVSPAEWAKYGREPLDLSDVRALAEDVLRTAASLGIDAVDARPALVAAEPGAFLKGDLHLSPRGHHAVADVLVEALRRPAPAPARAGTKRAQAAPPRERE